MIGQTVTIRAIAVKEGFDDSLPTSATFTIVGHDVDGDDDGLIDINNLGMLNRIRYKPRGYGLCR